MLKTQTLILVDGRSVITHMTQKTHRSPRPGTSGDQKRTLHSPLRDVRAGPQCGETYPRPNEDQTDRGTGTLSLGREQIGLDCFKSPGRLSGDVWV